MAVTDAPTVTIDGVTLASRWSLTERIALGGLAITWGRTTHLEQATPATLALEVLDTDGQIADTAALIGRRVTVVRGDGRTIFRGHVDDFEIDHVVMRDPDTQLKRRVWRLRLVVMDVLAALAKARLPGPGNEAAGIQYLGPNYWFLERPRTRFDSLLAAGASQVVAGITWSDPYPVTTTQPLMRFRAWADQLSALNHIEGAYQAHPLGYVSHDPHTNTLSVGRPADTLGLELTWDGDTLDVALADGVTIPARQAGVPNGYTATLGLDDTVDVVQIVSPMPRDEVSLDMVDATTEKHTARSSGAITGRREHRVVNEILYTLTAESTTRFEWPFPIESAGDEYGWRDDTNSFHYGIDFPQPQNTPIKAAGDGTVIVSEYHSGWGNHIRIDHGDGLITLYAHMVALGVPVGTKPKRGDVIGYVGNTGNSFGAHLHFETRVGESNPINPRDFMAQYGNSSGTPEISGEWQRRLAEDTAALLDQLNGRVVLPTIRLDWRHDGWDRRPSDAIASVFIDTTAKDAPIYFPGSVFATVYDAATEHQVIGGRLVYHKGWTLDATLAPAIRTRDGITVAQLVTIDPPLISDFADDLLIADLGNVTKGV